jgi:hypothetical protein
MTTAAWDGRTLAADTLGVQSNLKRKTSKVFRLKDGNLFAGCGEYDDVLSAREWLENGGSKPTLKDFSGLLVTPEGCFRVEHSLLRQPIAEPFTAIGSGRDFAIAAMYLGKSAVEAVDIACLYDAWTAGPIESMTLDHPLLRAVG